MLVHYLFSMLSVQQVLHISCNLGAGARLVNQQNWLTAGVKNSKMVQLKQNLPKKTTPCHDLDWREQIPIIKKCTHYPLDWIEQGLMSPPTQYRLSGRQMYPSCRLCTQTVTINIIFYFLGKWQNF